MLGRHTECWWPDQDGIKYYERGYDRELHERSGADNPFQHIRTKEGGPCSDLSVADWDGDGDFDLLVSDLHLPMRYFEQSDGKLMLVEGTKNPFHDILLNTTRRRPVMADWNGDGRMDLLLMPKIFERLSHNGGFSDEEFCSAPKLELTTLVLVALSFEVYIYIYIYIPTGSFNTPIVSDAKSARNLRSAHFSCARVVFPHFLIKCRFCSPKSSELHNHHQKWTQKSGS